MNTKEKKLNNRSKISLYLYLFFVLFGPKLFTVIDTSIIASLIMIVTCAFGDKERRTIDRNQCALLILLVIILVYGLIICLINGNFDIVFIGRMTRACASTVALYFFVKTHDDKEEIGTAIINLLIMHAIVVILSSLIFIDIQDALRWFTGFDKTARYFRSTGLMTGFDISGLLCAIGTILVLLQKKFNPIKYFIFLIALLFTSRFSLIIYAIMTIEYLIIKRKEKKAKIKKACILITLTPIAIIGMLLIILTTKNDITSNAINGFSESFPSIYKFVKNIDIAYANTDFNEAASANISISDNHIEAIFGKGIYGGGDSGYTRIINSIGIIGLIAVAIWHIKLFRDYTSRDDNTMLLTVLFVTILAILDFKNSYFFTGTFFEIMLLELSINSNKKFKEKNENIIRYI
ncbi:hypothetical protein IKG31_00875 [Candidatus Saccharibacteria bacterium]|nr:hypothetical protein [Candidatus Saccharibacteria bacterium]